MDFYRKYINPEHTGAELTAFFPQGARFAISREMIQRRPKADYEQLLAILSNDEDSYAGYFMEWLWSELFLGHSEPCSVPAKLAPVSHEAAMRSLSLRFPDSVERTRARSLAAVSGPGCMCAGVSGGISGGVSGRVSGGGISGGVSGSISGGISGCISGGVSGGISGIISGGVSGGVSGDVSGSFSGSVSGSSCDCGGVSGGISSGISGSISGGVSGSATTSLSTTPFASTTTTISSGTGGVSGSTTTSLSTTPFASTTTTISSSTSGDISGGVSGSATTSLSTTHSASTTTTTAAAAEKTFKVAGTLEVEIIFDGAVVHSVMVDIFKRAIANVLEVPLVNVAKLIASEIETRPGLRRLQSTQTKRYDVAYEVIVPSGMDADALVEKMNRIAVSGSSESQAFRQVLTSADGIAQVGQIVAKIPASKFEENATTPLGSKPEPLEEENSWTSLVIGSVAVFMALLCGTTTALLLKRKLQPFPTPVPGQKVDAETHRCVDGAILPGQEVDAEAGNGLVDGAILPGQERTSERRLVYL